MTNKTYLTWTYTRGWCEKNPEKMAAIVTPKGIFEIVFRPMEEKEISFKTEEYGWINKFFIE